MLQYKIPQNVELEDTIIGPITMRQLIICGVGGGIDYVLYLSLSKYYFSYVWGPPILFIGLITVAVAFLEVRNIRFVKWVFLMVEAFILPNKRVWDKRNSTQYIFQVSANKGKKGKDDDDDDGSAAAKKEAQVNNLDEITKALDMSGFMDEKQDAAPAKAKDHDLAAAALHDDDIHRQNARLDYHDEQQKIAAIRGNDRPLSSNQINTTQKPVVPPEHQQMLKDSQKQ